MEPGTVRPAEGINPAAQCVKVPVMAQQSSRLPFDVHSPTIRAVAIGVLVLLLQIPLALITSLVQERQVRRDEVAAEIGEKWGHGPSRRGALDRGPV